MVHICEEWDAVLAVWKGKPMAIRRENDRRDERPDGQTPEQGGEVPNDLPVIGQPRVRPEMIDFAEKVIVERRSLLKWLAAYDRGEVAGR